MPLTEYVSFNFQELLDLELKRAYRGKQPFSLALLLFANGIQAARAVRVLQTTLRDTDTVIRHGESGFFVFLTMTNKEGAQMVGERLRAAFQSRDYLAEGSPQTAFQVVTVSFPEDGDSRNSLLTRLENRLEI